MPTNAELSKQVKALEERVDGAFASIEDHLRNPDPHVFTSSDQSSVPVDQLHRALWKIANGHPIGPADVSDPGPDPVIIEHAAKQRGMDVDDYLLYVKDPENYTMRKAERESGN